MFSLLLVLLLSATPVQRNAVSEPIGPFGQLIQCARAVYPLYTTIRRHPELLRKDIAVLHAYQKLYGKFRGEKRKLLVAGQRYWFVGLFGCASTPTASRYQDGVHGCAEDKLTSRLHVLNRIAETPGTFMSTVADYDWMEPWYLNEFAQQYGGRHITVSGKVEMETCGASNPDSLDGRIEYEGSSIGIRFSGLSAEQLRFLCKSPSSGLDGTVRLDHGRPYLVATDVLGIAAASSK